MLMGFIDNQGNKIKFGCVNQTAPEQWNMPLTYIKSMALTANREKYCDYSASELSSVTVQQHLLLKQHDIYIKPDRLLDRWEGTIHHAALALHSSRHGEVPLTMELDGVVIGGTPDDYYDGLLLDYKTCKQYMVGWIDKAGGTVNFESKEEWWRQLNIYRSLCESNNMPVKEMQVSMYVKDWSYRSKCDHAEIREVEVCNSIDKWIIAKVRTLQDGKMIACTKSERWKDNLRCEHYCDVSDICKQNPTHAF